jgi:hypothetical protein
MERARLPHGFLDLVGELGTIYSVRFSTIVDHGFGRLTVIAALDPETLQFQLRATTLSADLELGCPLPFELSIESLIPLLETLVKAGEKKAAASQGVPTHDDKSLV